MYELTQGQTLQMSNGRQAAQRKHSAQSKTEQVESKTEALAQRKKKVESTANRPAQSTSYIKTNACKRRLRHRQCANQRHIVDSCNSPPLPFPLHLNP